MIKKKIIKGFTDSVGACNSCCDVLPFSQIKDRLVLVPVNKPDPQDRLVLNTSDDFSIVIRIREQRAQKIITYTPIPTICINEWGATEIMRAAVENMLTGYMPKTSNKEHPYVISITGENAGWIVALPEVVTRIIANCGCPVPEMAAIYLASADLGVIDLDYSPVCQSHTDRDRQTEILCETLKRNRTRFCEEMFVYCPTGHGANIRPISDLRDVEKTARALVEERN